MTKICIPIVEKNIETLLKKIFTAAKKNPDIIEIWLGEIFANPGDFENNGEEFFTKIFNAKKEINNIPFLFTVKDSKEKGNFLGTDTEKISILIKAVQMGAEYIDIDYQFDEALLEKLKDEILKNNEEKNNKNIESKLSTKTKLILSAHFFKGTPSFPSLKNRVQNMINFGADIVKIAAMPECEKDVLSILRLSENLHRKEIPFIAISMGQMGKFSRIISPLLGSYIAFGALDKNSASAPGQIEVETIRKNIAEFRF